MVAVRRRDEAGRLITFETQSRVDRAWRTTGIFDDRLSAVAEAERLLKAKRTPAVRVVQVLFDPQSTKCAEYTVFRATCFDDENEPVRRRVPDQEMFEWGAGDAAAKTEPSWIERHWPSWGPDWATTALGLSFAVLLASILFRWVR